MTEISAHTQNFPVHRREDIEHFYAGTDAREGDEPKIGIEIEQTLYNADDLSLIPVENSIAMEQQGERDRMPVHHEPSATSLEIVTAPFTLKNLGGLIEQIEGRFKYLTNLAANNGYTLSPFGHMPHVRLGDHEIVPKERYQIFWNPPREDMTGASNFFANCMNIQSSASYNNPETLLKVIRLAVALEPLIFLSTDSNAGFFEGTRAAYSLPLHMNLEKGINGGIPDFYYSARTGRELIDAHIDFTLNNKHVFAYFDFNDRLQRLPVGEWASYNDLGNMNLAPRTLVNYRQAQSESWRRALNIATIDDENGNLISHRAELASFQTGLMHQRVTAPLLTNLMAFDEIFYEKTAALLRTYGIDLDNLAGCRDVLEGNFKAAVYHENQFTNVQFGTGTLGELAARMADIVEERYEASAFTPYVAPIVHIWRSGRPDWLVYRECFPTLDAVKSYLSKFPHYVEDNPALLSAQSCADWVLSGYLEKGMRIK